MGQTQTREGLTPEQEQQARRMVLEGIFELFPAQREPAIADMRAEREYHATLVVLGVSTELRFTPDELKLTLGRLALRGA
jgi:hypothetical protein